MAGSSGMELAMLPLERSSAASFVKAWTRIFSCVSSTLTVPGVRVMELAYITRPRSVLRDTGTSNSCGLTEERLKVKMRLMTSMFALRISRNMKTR